MRNILIACEESQAICIEFRKLGFNAYSCDIQECSGGRPEWHFNCDMFEVVNNKVGVTQDGNNVSVDKWDLMIAHPPCTFLAVSGARWMYHPEDKHLPIDQRRPHPLHPTRKKDQLESIEFVKQIMNCDIERIAIENPIGVLSSAIRKPDQIIHPWMFGDEASKATCLWLKGLPLLKETNIVSKGEVVEYSSGKKMSEWYADGFSKSPEERRKIRSKTFKGIAEAIANQWGSFLMSE